MSTSNRPKPGYRLEIQYHLPLEKGGQTKATHQIVHVRGGQLICECKSEKIAEHILKLLNADHALKAQDESVDAGS